MSLSNFMDMDHVEQQAQQLRAMLLLSPYAPLNPYHLADKMRVPVLTPHHVSGLSTDDLRLLLVEEAHTWSAGALPLSDGRFIIVVNPTHSDTRKRATLMEELAHIYLKHRPSQLTTSELGMVKRSFDKGQEAEAYWVGAAALVPRAVLQVAQAYQMSIGELALYCGVSQKLAAFRSNVTHLKLSKFA